MTTKTMTPKTTMVICPCPRCYLGYHDQPELAEKYRRVSELQTEVARLKELVEWYKSGMESCWNAANTYDGNYVKACDNVMHIASERLKDALKAKIK